MGARSEERERIGWAITDSWRDDATYEKVRGRLRQNLIIDTPWMNAGGRWMTQVDPWSEKRVEDMANLIWKYAPLKSALHQTFLNVMEAEWVLGEAREAGFPIEDGEPFERYKGWINELEEALEKVKKEPGKDPHETLGMLTKNKKEESVF